MKNNKNVEVRDVVLICLKKNRKTKKKSITNKLKKGHDPLAAVDIDLVDMAGASLIIHSS